MRVPNGYSRPKFVFGSQSASGNPKNKSKKSASTITMGAPDATLCAYIFELFWPAVHAAVGQLSFGEPPSERRNVDHVQSI